MWALFYASASPHEPQIRRRKATEIGQHQRQVAAGHAEPAGQSRRVLIYRCGRNPAALAGVVRAVDGERRKLAVEAPAAHRAAEHEVVAAPAVVRAVAVGDEGAAEIGGGEGGHGVADAELVHRRVEGTEGA